MAVRACPWFAIRYRTWIARGALGHGMHRLSGVCRISSSGRDCPDRFKLDQLRRPDFPGRRGTAVNCNPNCYRGISAWGVPWLVLAVLTLQQLGQLLAGRRQVRAQARRPVIFVGPG